MLLSIVIPCYQPDESLTVFLDMVHQELRGIDYEICIVDDKSPSLCEGLLCSLNLRSGRDSLIRLPRNKGANFARRLGMRFVRGKYVVFHDADDLFYEGRYKEILGILLSGSPDLVYGTIEYRKTSDMCTLSTQVVPTYRSSVSGANLLFLYNFIGTGFQTSSLVVKRELIKPFFWPLQLKGHQDWYFLLCLFGNQSIIASRTVIPSIRDKMIKKNSISSSLSPEFSFVFWKRNRKKFSFRASVYFLIFIVARKYIDGQKRVFRVMFYALILFPLALLNFYYLKALIARFKL